MGWFKRKKDENTKKFSEDWTWHHLGGEKLCPACHNGERWTVTAPDGRICGWVEKGAHYWIGVFEDKKKWDRTLQRTTTERSILTYGFTDQPAEFISADAAMQAFEEALNKKEAALKEDESEKNPQEDQGSLESEKPSEE
jgi:hypothetical protein